MKYFSFVFVTFFMAGCQWQTISSVNNTEPEIFWVNYYPTQCNVAPWGDTLEETAVIDYYTTTMGITVHSVEVTPPDVGFFSCSACGCPTGVQVSIQTNADGRVTLLEHGFVEEELESQSTLNEDEDNGIAENAEEKAEDTEAELSEADQELQNRAELVQSALRDYYTLYGAYPDRVEDLTVKLDTTGMTYTPIGVTPAEYYDLSVEYSTGREVMNP